MEQRERNNEKEGKKEVVRQTRSPPLGIRLLAHTVPPICWQMEGHYLSQNPYTKPWDLVILFFSEMGISRAWQWVHNDLRKTIYGGREDSDTRYIHGRFQSSEPKPTQLPTAYIGIVYSLLIWY